MNPQSISGMTKERLSEQLTVNNCDEKSLEQNNKKYKIWAALGAPAGYVVPAWRRAQEGAAWAVDQSSLALRASMDALAVGEDRSEREARPWLDQAHTSFDERHWTLDAVALTAKRATRHHERVVAAATPSLALSVATSALTAVRTTPQRAVAWWTSRAQPAQTVGALGVACAYMWNPLLTTAVLVGVRVVCYRTGASAPLCTTWSYVMNEVSALQAVVPDVCWPALMVSFPLYQGVSVARWLRLAALGVPVGVFNEFVVSTAVDVMREKRIHLNALTMALATLPFYAVAGFAMFFTGSPATGQWVILAVASPITEEVWRRQQPHVHLRLAMLEGVGQPMYVRAFKFGLHWTLNRAGDDSVIAHTMWNSAATALGAGSLEGFDFPSFLESDDWLLGDEAPPPPQDVPLQPRAAVAGPMPLLDTDSDDDDAAGRKRSRQVRRAARSVVRAAARSHVLHLVQELIECGVSQRVVWQRLPETAHTASRSHNSLTVPQLERVLRLRSHQFTDAVADLHPPPVGRMYEMVGGCVAPVFRGRAIATYADLEYMVLPLWRTERQRDLLRWVFEELRRGNMSWLPAWRELAPRGDRMYTVRESTMMTRPDKTLARAREAAATQFVGFDLASLVPEARQQAGEWLESWTNMLMSPDLKLTSLWAIVGVFKARGGELWERIHDAMRQFLEALEWARTYASDTAEALSLDPEGWWAHVWTLLRESASAKWSEWLTSPLCAAVWRLLSTLSLSGLVYVCGWTWDRMSFSSACHALEVLATRNTSPLTFLASFINALSEFVALVLSWYHTGDWWSLHSVRKPAAMVSELDALAHNTLVRRVFSDSLCEKRLAEAVASGTVPATLGHTLTEEQRLVRLEAAVAEAARTQRVDPDGSSKAGLPAMVSKARDECHRIRSALSAGARHAQGMGFMLLGTGGTGKSVLAMQILASIGARLNLPPGAEFTMSYTAGSNFQDTAGPGKWAVVMDDPEMALYMPGPGAVNYAADWIRYLNGAPCNIEAAAVERKGEVFADFVAGAMIMNKPPSLNMLLTDPYPFWRRFAAIVRVEVKEKYRNGAGGLDRDKLDGSNDYHECHVRLPDPSAYDPNQPFTTCPFSKQAIVMSHMECTAAIGERIAAHYRRDMRHVAEQDSALPVLCSKCFLVRAAHSAQPCAGAHWVDASGDVVSADEVEQIELDGRELRAVREADWLALPVAKGKRGTKMQSMEAGVSLAWCLAFIYLLVVLDRYRVMVARLIDVKTERAMVGVNHIVANGQRITEAVERAERSLAAVTGPAATAVVATGAAMDAAADTVHLLHQTVDAGRRAGETVAVLVGCAAALAAAYTALCALRKRVVRRGEVYQMFTYREPLRDDRDKDKWDRVEQTYFKPTAQMATGKLEELAAACGRNIGVFHGDGKVVHAFRVCGRFWVTVSHAVPADGHRCQMLFGSNSLVDFIPVNGENALHIPNSDLCVLRVDNLPAGDKDFRPYLSERTCYGAVGTADFAGIAGIKGVRPSADGALFVRHARIGMGWQYTISTVDGDCGQPLVLTYGKAQLVAGLHSLGYTEGGRLTGVGVCSEMTREGIDAAIAKLSHGVPVFQARFDGAQLERRAADVAVGPMPARSSFTAAAALLAHVPNSMATFFPLGTLLKPKPLSDYRTETRDSLLRPFLKDIEDRTWGPAVRVHAPNYKGRVVVVPEAKTPLYTDPWVDNLMGYNTGSTVRPDLLRLAVEDYLHDVPDLGAYRPFTVAEALTGVPGVFDALRMDTSAGQPFGGPKGGWADKTELKLHPDVTDLMHSFMNDVAEGAFPMPVFTHVPKDEPTTKDFPRIFNVGPMHLLLLTRMYVFPVFAALREHREFWECSIGANLLGHADVQKFVRMYLRGDDKRAKKKTFGDGDYKWYDISLFAALTRAVTEIVVRLARHMGASPAAVLMLTAVLEATFQSIRFIKNDLFVVCGTTPSGVLLTGEINSLINSLIARCAYYWSLAGGGPLPRFGTVIVFRGVVVYQSTGDDNFFDSQTEHFNMWVMSRFCATIGVRYTRSDKVAMAGPQDSERTFEECQYLKRSFRLDEDGYWRAALEPKSMVKMMLMEKRSTLSRPDHCAILATNSCREAYFHGRTAFVAHLATVTTAVKEAGLAANPLWHVESYEAYDVQFLAGTLKTWGPSVDLSAYVRPFDRQDLLV